MTGVRFFHNEFDWREIVVFDGESYWADGQSYPELLKCFDADGLDYGVPNPFAELPRAELVPLLSAYRNLSPYVEDVLPVVEATSRWAHSVHTFCSKRNVRGIRIEGEGPVHETLGRALYHAVDELGAGPYLFFEVEYFVEKLRHLEAAVSRLGREHSTVQPQSEHSRIRYFQSRIDPFEIVLEHEGRFFVRGLAVDAIHDASYTEIGKTVAKKILSIGAELREAFQSSRGYLNALLGLRNHAATLGSASFSVPELDEGLTPFVGVLEEYSTELDEFVSKVYELRRCAAWLERPLKRIA